MVVWYGANAGTCVYKEARGMVGRNGGGISSGLIFGIALFLL
jgi:hypothetical protein